MLNIQNLVDGLSKQWQGERSKSQMTLGALVDRLAGLPPETMIDGLAKPHSYRGYYSDLAFQSREGKMSVTEALALCKSAMGEVFQGWKGGDYQMGRNTPVWIAERGYCGDKILSLRDDGTFELGKDEW